MSNFGHDRFPCRFPAARPAGNIFSLPARFRETTQAIAGKRFYVAAEGFFSPGGEVFPCVSRAAGKMARPCEVRPAPFYRPDPRRRVGRPGSARSCSDRPRPSDPLSRPRPPETASSGSPGSFLSACARSRRSSSIRVRIVAKSSAARGRFTFPLLKIGRAPMRRVWFLRLGGGAEEGCLSLAHRRVAKQAKITAPSQGAIRSVLMSL